METAFEMETKRMLKAKIMIEQNVPAIHVPFGDIYRVQSNTNAENFYTVTHSGNRWHCDCEDHKYNKVHCKHIWYVILLKEKEAKKPKEIRQITPIDNVECPECHSTNLMKYGVRHNKASDLQRYQCYDCGKTFSINVGFEKMKHNPKAVTMAMQLYFSGESLRNTKKSLRLVGADVSHVTISKWIEKYVTIMKAYCDSLKPNVSDTWQADEVFIRMQGDIKYLFAILDDETRYIIAQEVAETKDKHDACELFHMGHEIAGKKPELMITDGLPSYRAAFDKEYRGSGNKHLNTIRLTGKHNNNRMERVNGEIRDREKTMRGLKNKNTSILPGYQIYHNYIRPHESLDGKTPAEACGIELKGDNKWLTLIQHASLKTKTV